MELMRDHYEGTPYDMTKGVDAGPFGSPLRLRDLAFSVDGKGYMWERPISTQQAGFVIVTQSRKDLPDADRRRHLVHARRGVHLVLHARSTAPSTRCRSRIPGATTRSSPGIRPGG